MAIFNGHVKFPQSKVWWRQKNDCDSREIYTAPVSFPLIQFWTYMIDFWQKQNDQPMPSLGVWRYIFLTESFQVSLVEDIACNSGLPSKYLQTCKGFNGSDHFQITLEIQCPINLCKNLMICQNMCHVRVTIELWIHSLVGASQPQKLIEKGICPSEVFLHTLLKMAKEAWPPCQY